MLDQPLATSEFLVVDTETNGRMGDDCELTEVGAVLVGGGELVGSFADAGLLDEILLGMQPVFLGAGAPLLPRRLTSKRIRLESARQDGQQVLLVYSVTAP